jgi:hypothetical protein
VKKLASERRFITFRRFKVIRKLIWTVSGKYKFCPNIEEKNNYVRISLRKIERIKLRKKRIHLRKKRIHLRKKRIHLRKSILSITEHLSIILIIISLQNFSHNIQVHSHFQHELVFPSVSAKTHYNFVQPPSFNPTSFFPLKMKRSCISHHINFHVLCVAIDYIFNKVKIIIFKTHLSSILLTQIGDLGKLKYDYG